MAIRIHMKRSDGPLEIPGLGKLLDNRKVSIEGSTAMCPHCFKDQNTGKLRKSLIVCRHCGRTFFLLRKGLLKFLTSKTEFPQ